MAEVSKRPRKLHGPSNRAWSVNDELVGRLGRKPTREEAMAAAVNEGLNAGTADGQYSLWSREFDARARSGARTPPAALTESARLTVAANGRVIIPKPMRDAMRLSDDGTVTAFIDEDGAVTLVTPDAAIAKAQRMARLLDPDGGSVVDELIAERRAEAARERLEP